MRRQSLLNISSLFGQLILLLLPPFLLSFFLDCPCVFRLTGSAVGLNLTPCMALIFFGANRSLFLIVLQHSLSPFCPSLSVHFFSSFPVYFVSAFDAFSY